ncbi:TipAS antibiotic-recognition domain-containing protein [Leifsonia sp. AG29]|uniref:TipAS antibiotic-recognition domain-containing protein n=1 Tax=Leifsonia sp. AG29 TaxID=2598860 RepID=UPI00131D984C|nr:TipAS antibiotic-recognition domain-containing protein [Leifsonia sp. AG29]
MSDDDKREMWGDFADREDELLDEVEARWGETNAYQESARKVSRYTKQDWAQINAGNTAIEARIRELMDAGADPTSEEAIDVAEAQRVHISRWFYAMDHEFHVQKSQLYVDDDRFRDGIERNTRPGAAEWLQAAIIANARRARLGR